MDFDFIKIIYCKIIHYPFCSVAEIGSFRLSKNKAFVLGEYTFIKYAPLFIKVTNSVCCGSSP